MMFREVEENRHGFGERIEIKPIGSGKVKKIKVVAVPQHDSDEEKSLKEPQRAV